MTPVRIMIADDHAMFREGLHRLLESDTGFEIVGKPETESKFLELAPKLKPTVLLLGLAMPRQSGLESLPTLVQQVPNTRIILLTASIETGETIEALKIGARGIVLLSLPPWR